MRLGADCTVKRVLESICQHQGEFLRGAPKRDAVEKVVGALVRVLGDGSTAQANRVGSAPPGGHLAAEPQSAVGAAVVPSPSTPLAPVPPEVPMLPESAVDRPDLMGALKQRVLRLEAGGGANAADINHACDCTGWQPRWLAECLLASDSAARGCILCARPCRSAAILGRV